MRLASLVVGLSLPTILGTGAAAAQTYPELTRERELRLAMSAGPPTVSEHADVYVLLGAGFERVREGSNGWACLVVRVTGSSEQLAPHCLNPQAVKTVLPALLREGTLQMQGMNRQDIDAELTRQFSTGELPMPSGPAYAYMMSAGQRLGPNASQFRPHFMLYVPYISNRDIGGDPSHPEYPFVGPYENRPLSTVVILMEEFVRPEDISLPSR